MQETASIMRKGKVIETLARTRGWERKLRHRSRVMKLARIPKVKEGRLLDDERAWMDC
jgi:hypothetical protein